MSRALILLNPAAHGGRSGAKFATIEDAMVDRLDAEVVVTDGTSAWRAAVDTALDAGVRLFIAAGGDGTVGALAGQLAARRKDVPLGDMTLGAIGLGSSNDFHKPFRRMLGKVPVCIDPDPERCTLRDVAVARLAAVGEPMRDHYFVVSASVGLVASANEVFNQARGPLAWLKPRWTTGAIAAAGLASIAATDSLEADLRIETESESIVRRASITNLSVLKTPHLSGGFRYDTAVAPSDGQLAVNLFEGRGRLDTVRAMIDLGSGRFVGRSGCRHWRARRLEVTIDHTVPVELDGEIVDAAEARFELLPDQLRQCA